MYRFKCYDRISKTLKFVVQFLVFQLVRRCPVLRLPLKEYQTIVPKPPKNVSSSTSLRFFTNRNHLNRNRIVVLVLFSAQFYMPSHQSITLNCQFTVTDFWEIGNIYACKGSFTVYENLDSERLITSLLGSPDDNKTNEDVLGVKFYAVKLTFVPRGLESFFPNIKAFTATSCDFTEISQLDFIGFENLRQIHFYGNKLQSLSSDLFESKLNLQHISFGGNPLRHVGPNTFRRLKNLESLYLERSNCISAFAIRNKVEVDKLIFKLAVSCPPSYEMLEDELTKSSALIKKVDDLAMEKISSLSYQLIELEAKIKLLTDKISSCNCY